MRETVLSLFLAEKLCNPAKIASRLNIAEKEVIEILHSEHYLVSPSRTFEVTLRIKDAVDYYLSDEKISATKAAKKFRLQPTNFCLNLKELGIDRPNNQNRTKFNETVFDTIDTEEKAYWLGFIWADGTISRHVEGVKKRYQFELSLTDADHTHLNKFNAFMQHEKDNVTTGNVVLEGKIFKRCRWIVTNKHLWETLNNLGCVPNKSLVLKFPDESIFSDMSLIRHFIRGYFDGDGSLGLYELNTKFSVSLLGTKEMLNPILEYGGIKASLGSNHHSKITLRFQTSFTQGLRFLNYMYKDSTIYLDRKYEKYLDICRLFGKPDRLLQTNIGESCDANTEITEETKKSSAS